MLASDQGPDIVGGYPCPENPALTVSQEEHAKRGYSKRPEKVWHDAVGAHEPAGQGLYKDRVNH